MPSSSHRLAQEEGDSGKDAENSNHTGSGVLELRSLSPKPCYNCGREISPRAKWARNWDFIKFCSTQCKGWKSIDRVGSFNSNEDISTLSSESKILKSCLVSQGEHLLLHLDAWIESTIFHLVADAKDSKQTIALQAVSDHMDSELTCTIPAPSYCVAITDGILSRNPGQREMIRRAARRLIILPPEDWPFTRLFEKTDLRIELSSDRGKRTLRTLRDVSFAKGEMYIRRA